MRLSPRACRDNQETGFGRYTRPARGSSSATPAGGIGLDHGARRSDGLARVFETREVLAEHAGKLGRIAAVRLRVAPGRPRVEQRALDAVHLARDLEAEDRVDAVLDAVEGPGESRPQQSARGGDRHPLPLAVRTARPAGVDEPDCRV